MPRGSGHLHDTPASVCQWTWPGVLEISFCLVVWDAVHRRDPQLTSGELCWYYRDSGSGGSQSVCLPHSLPDRIPCI